MTSKIDLKDLHVLVVDCQTTGGKADNNVLLEIGWLAVRASDLDQAEALQTTTFLVKPMDGQALTSRVEKLTGIDAKLLEPAIDAVDAGRAFFEEVARASARQGIQPCPAVIHFARFEMPFLKRLHRLVNPLKAFPLDIICTHQIAARLFPGLPRKGLRAVAGYFGHGLPGLKRCDAHLRATAHVWRHLVVHLAADADISTMDQLRRWLKSTPVPVTPSRRYPMPREERLGIPNAPGVYHMKRTNGDLLYIGKARSLRQRVNSYFQKSRRHSENTLEMLTQATRLDVTVTRTALAAALLESDEIKQLNPTYNIALTAGKRELAFFSGDFGYHASKRDDLCRLGPVPVGEQFSALHAMGKYLSGDMSLETGHPGAGLLALRVGNDSDEENLRLGLDLFRQKYGSILKNGAIWRALIRIGRLSWAQRMQTRENQGKIEETLKSLEEEGDKAPKEFSWTPETVVQYMEALLRQCGVLLRRARWLTMISESTVAWEERGLKPTRMNILAVQNGKIVRQSQIDAQASLPVPNGCGLAFKYRQSCLDAATYDRLRVLTTEFRRLLSEKRRVCIRLSPTACIDAARLECLLRWF